MSLSHCQELDQLADLASDWLYTCVANQKPDLLVNKTLDNTYTTHKFPFLGAGKGVFGVGTIPALTVKVRPIRRANR